MPTPSKARVFQCGRMFSKTFIFLSEPLAFMGRELMRYDDPGLSAALAYANERPSWRERPLVFFEKQGIRFVQEQVYTADQLMAAAKTLDADYVRHGGAESINAARGLKNVPLEERLSSKPKSAGWLELAFESGHRLGWGHLDFEYKDKGYCFQTAWGLTKR